MVNIQRLHVLVVLITSNITKRSDNVQNKQYVIRKYNKKCGYDLRGELKKKKNRVNNKEELVQINLCSEFVE